MSGGFTAEQLASAFLGRRDKALLIGALAAVVSLAWAYLVLSAAHMDMTSGAHSAMAMTPAPWTASHFLLTLLMWAVMMVAMMLPSATPMVLTYAAVARRIALRQRQAASIALFIVGYVLVWSAFSIGATVLQWGLERAALLSPMMVTSSSLLGGALLIAAGLYQWSQLKEFCLRRCQAPLAFVAQHWRAGPSGALRMGVGHGLYCVGCCWSLMLLLFLGGVMNLLWVAAISVFVLLEKLIGAGTPAGRWISGGGLIAARVAARPRALRTEQGYWLAYRQCCVRRPNRAGNVPIGASVRANHNMTSVISGGGLARALRVDRTGESCARSVVDVLVGEAPVCGGRQAVPVRNSFPALAVGDNLTARLRGVGNSVIQTGLTRRREWNSIPGMNASTRP